LIHRNPSRVQSFDLMYGQAYVFYPGATAERCSASIFLDEDPIGFRCRL